MKSFLILLLVLLPQLADAAGNAPWYGDENDCHQQWYNRGTGCRLRKEGYNAEAAGIDGQITSAEAARDACVEPKQITAVFAQGLLEKKRDREEIFVPHLERTVELCEEMKTVLMSAGKELAKLMGLAGFLKIKATVAGPELERLAVLSSQATDEIALGMILDLGTRVRAKAKPSALKASPNAKVSFAIVLSILEENLGAMTKTIESVVGTLGKLYALNAEELAMQREELEQLKKETQSAVDKRDERQKAYDTALARVNERKQRKRDLPGQATGEQSCENDALSYWNNENKCANHYYELRKTDTDHRGGGNRL